MSIKVLGYKDISPYKNRKYIDIQSNEITMKGVSKDLLGQGYDKNNKLIESKLMKAGEENYTFPKNVEYVREIPIENNNKNKLIKAKKGSKIFPNYKMFLYNSGGNLVQLNGNGSPEVALVGEERIFSIIHTKEIIDMSFNAKTKEDIIALGRRIEQIIDKQNTQKPEYVKD